MARGLSQKQLDRFISPEAAMAPYARKQQSDIQKADADARLAQLIKGQELEREAVAQDMEYAQQMRDKYGPEADVSVGKARIGGFDPLMRFLRQQQINKPQLTPGQETAEKEGAKKVAAYDVAGGSSAMDKHIKAQEEVLKEIQGGKRDFYDKAAGKVLGGFPRAMAVFAPTEKARMDKIQAAAIQNIRATDPQPAQVLIDQTLSRAYDPRLSDEENIAKIQADYEAAKNTKAQMEQAAKNLQETGYVLPGLSGGPRINAAPKQQQAPAGAQQSLTRVTIRNASGETHVLDNPSPQDLQEAAADGFQVVR